jgi:hypothetical protein
MLVNLTPHTINIYDETGTSLLESVPTTGSDHIARVSQTKVKAGVIDIDQGLVPVFTYTYGEIVGLPVPKNSIYYIVSGMVKAATSRRDVLSPGDLLRDEKGRPKGCIGLKG